MTVKWLDPTIDRAYQGAAFPTQLRIQQMYIVASVARRRARSLLPILGLALGACAEDPVAPKMPSTPSREALLESPDGQYYVTNTSGGTEVGSLRWAAAQVGINGGVIFFDPSIAGDTIVLDAELAVDVPMYISGPEDKGITISGKDQHRVIGSSTFLGIRNVTITKGAAEWGSAIWAVSLTMANSTVQDNRGPGSAIFVEDNLTMDNSTVSRNAVGAPAVHYKNGLTGRISNSTIAFNAPAPGLGLYDVASQYPARLLVRNSIIANNGSPLRNCSTQFGLEFVSANIVSDWTCGEVGMTVTDPLLFALAQNGGPSMTHAIPHTSPAYNKGIDCWVEVDQRYVDRDAKCDIGAFEFNDFTRISITIDPNTKIDAATGRALLTGTIKCTRADAFRLALELHQSQKVGKQVVDVHSAADIPVACATTAKPWSASMGLAVGEAFQNGPAKATAMTFQMPEWVAPASAAGAVKLVR